MAADDVLALLDRDPSLLRGVAARTLALTGRADDYAEDELEQLVHAFGGAIREALAGTGTEARDLLLQTGIPAVVARGQTAAQLARSGAAFGALFTATVAERLDADAREGAVATLATFFGDWARDVVEAAEGAS